MFALAEGSIVALSGVAVAFTTGVFAFAGIVVSAKAQKEPDKVKVDDPRVIVLAEALAEARKDRDFWRDLALSGPAAASLDRRRDVWTDTQRQAHQPDQEVPE